MVNILSAIAVNKFGSCQDLGNVCPRTNSSFFSYRLLKVVLKYFCIILFVIFVLIFILPLLKLQFSFCSSVFWHYTSWCGWKISLFLAFFTILCVRGNVVHTWFVAGPLELVCDGILSMCENLLLCRATPAKPVWRLQGGLAEGSEQTLPDVPLSYPRLHIPARPLAVWGHLCGFKESGPGWGQLWINIIVSYK